MIDVFDILNTPGANVQIFKTTGTTGVYNTWIKPRGSNMLFIYAIGGGGSGGGSVATDNASGGGGGGGSSASTTLLIPTMCVPDSLYVDVGFGGRTTAGAAGVAGSNTTITIEPSETANVNFLLVAYGGGGGGIANTTAGGAGGTAGTLALIGNMRLAGRGFHYRLAGAAGSAGMNANTTGTPAVTFLSSGICCGGAGGGAASNTSTGYAGGTVFTASTFLFTQYFNASTGTIIQGGSGASSSTPAGSGRAGFVCPNFSGFMGGTGGGGASNTVGGIAGDGGPGAFGSGGGGAGGSNLTNSTLGKGGDGGDGLVIMVTF